MLKSIFSAISGVNKHIIRSRQATADLYLLNHLTDRELKDIGITRGDILHRYYNKD
jgi:uncharacterized protein YjiS (DUF1127 family)